jgi:tRNA/rRNA methyltransferase
MRQLLKCGESPPRIARRKLTTIETAERIADFSHFPATDYHDIMSDTLLSRCRVVLVRPHYAGNLGSTARVMRNFGLADLVLVAPYARIENPEARRLATHGLPVLESAKIVPELGDALADCVFSVATSALTAGVVRRGMIGTPSELAPSVLDAAQSGPVAIVFGPEPHGLSNEEIGRCNGLLHVPVDAEFSSLNLAQAVGICCYELRQAWSRRMNEERGTPQAGPVVAPHSEQERMFDHLREGLQAVGFLFGSRQDTLMHAMRQLIARAMPSPGEVRMLHGLARQLLWIARNGEREPSVRESYPGEPQLPDAD